MRTPGFVVQPDHGSLLFDSYKDETDVLENFVAFAAMDEPSIQTDRKSLGFSLDALDS